MTEQQKETVVQNDSYHDVAKILKDNEAEYLIQDFVDWAQNNEMIDTEYLQHGKDLLTALEELK